MNIKDQIQLFLLSQPELVGKKYLRYHALNTLSIICIPLYFLLALIAVAIFVLILLLIWFKPVAIYPATAAIIILIYVTKCKTRAKPNKECALPSINEVSNLIDSWANRNGFKKNTLNLDEENLRISLSNNKSDETIIVDYTTQPFDECLIINYQNYQLREHNPEKILTIIKVLPALLDTLMLHKFTIIIEHYSNKLIDSNLKITIDNTEHVFCDRKNQLAIANSRLRKYLNVNTANAPQHDN